MGLKSLGVLLCWDVIVACQNADESHSVLEAVDFGVVWRFDVTPLKDLGLLLNHDCCSYHLLPATTEA